MRHSKLEPASLASKSKSASVEFVRLGGVARERRVRRGVVDGEGALGRSLDVPRGVDRAVAHDVVAVGGEVRRGERQRPRCSTGCRAPVLASVREGRAVPELAVRRALDRDLDAVDRCPAGVRRGSAEAGPAGVVVAGRGRQRERGARIGQVDRPGEARRRRGRGCRPGRSRAPGRCASRRRGPCSSSATCRERTSRRRACSRRSSRAGRP